MMILSTDSIWCINLRGISQNLFFSLKFVITYLRNKCSVLESVMQIHSNMAINYRGLSHKRSSIYICGMHDRYRIHCRCHLIPTLQSFHL